MNIIKYLKAKKMIKIINKEIKVRYAKRLECEPDNAKVYVGFKNNKMENDTFRDYVNELTSNCKYNDLLLGILHEIGHVYTIDQVSEEEYLKDVELLLSLRKEHLISAKQMNYFYLRLPLESIATKWAIEFAKLNPQFCDCWNKKLS